MHVCENIAYPELITCHVELWVLSRNPIKGFLPWIQKQQNFFSNSHVSLSVILLCSKLVNVPNTEWTSYKYINNSSSKITAYLLLHSFNHIVNNTRLCNSLVYYFPTVLHNHLQNLSLPKRISHGKFKLYSKMKIYLSMLCRDNNTACTYVFIFCTSIPFIVDSNLMEELSWVLTVKTSSCTLLFLLPILFLIDFTTSRAYLYNKLSHFWQYMRDGRFLKVIMLFFTKCSFATYVFPPPV